MRVQGVERLECARLQWGEAVSPAEHSALSQAPSCGQGRLSACHMPPVSVLEQCTSVLLCSPPGGKRMDILRTMPSSAVKIGTCCCWAWAGAVVASP